MGEIIGLDLSEEQLNKLEILKGNTDKSYSEIITNLIFENLNFQGKKS